MPRSTAQLSTTRPLDSSALNNSTPHNTAPNNTAPNCSEREGETEQQTVGKGTEAGELEGNNKLP